MKPAVLVIFLVGALVTGALGGLAMDLLNPPPPPAVVTADAEQPAPADTALDQLDAQERTIAALRARLTVIEAALRQSTESRTEATQLKQKVDALEEHIRRAEEGPAMVAPQPGADGLAPAPGAGLDPKSEAFKEAVDKAMRDRRSADRRRMMQRWQDRLLGQLDEKLALHEDQKAKIKEILTVRMDRMSDVMKRGRAAREANEDFDWGGEMRKLSQETTTAVKEQLDASQQSTLEEAIGPDGTIDELSGWGPGRHGRDGGREGNRGAGN